MDQPQKSIAETVKDNIKREFDEARPKDWRDWAHWATDGWLEPLDKGPQWLLPAALGVFALIVLIAAL